MSATKRDIVEELHKPVRINFKRRKVIIRGLDDLFQADLVEMIPYAKYNKKYRYILIVIDAFSKYVWAAPLKTKTGKEVTCAMKNILTTDDRIPANIQSDLGKEFYNKDFQELMKKYNINHYSSFSTKKSSIVERVNRTLKSKMYKEFSINGSFRWYDLLDKIIAKYNITKHRTLGMAPADVNKSNEQMLLKSVYNYPTITYAHISKFRTGDLVRISKYRGVFNKGYTPNWSNEIFTISKVQYTDPITYLLKDSQDHDIKGCFYTEELLKVKHPDVYLVEKVLKKKGNMIFVKWLGFDNSHNSWIHKDSNI